MWEILLIFSSGSGSNLQLNLPNSLWMEGGFIGNLGWIDFHEYHNFDPTEQEFGSNHYSSNLE